MTLSPHTTGDGTLTWVPSCTECGAQLDEPAVEGDERRPEPEEDLFGQVQTCSACGAKILVDPDTVWIRVDVTPCDRALSK